VDRRESGRLRNAGAKHIQAGRSDAAKPDEISDEAGTERPLEYYLAKDLELYLDKQERQTNGISTIIFYPDGSIDENSLKLFSFATKNKRRFPLCKRGTACIMRFPTKPTAGTTLFAKRLPGRDDEASSRGSRATCCLHAWIGLGTDLVRFGRRMPHLRPTPKAAFTFVEVLAAMLFMAIVIPAALRGIQIANRAGVVAARKSTAIQLADKLLNETLLTSNLRSSGQGGNFPDAYKDYRWRQSQRTWPEDAMREITVESSIWFKIRNTACVYPRW